jgi:hypothetical protein
VVFIDRIRVEAKLQWVLQPYDFADSQLFKATVADKLVRRFSKFRDNFGKVTLEIATLY